MALPDSVSTGTVTGTLLKLDGTPMVGAVVTFKPSVPRLLVAEDPVTILPGRIVVTTDNAGAFSVVLAATDDDSVSPVGWTWHVDIEPVKEKGGAAAYGFNFELPTGDTVDITTVTPVAI